MKSATFYNTQTNETTTRRVQHMGHAISIIKEVCVKMNWNENMFADDVELTVRPTYTVSLETPKPNCSLLKKELERLEISTRKTSKVTHNGYDIISYTAPVQELIFMLELFWDMTPEHADEFIHSHKAND